MTASDEPLEPQPNAETLADPPAEQHEQAPKPQEPSAPDAKNETQADSESSEPSELEVIREGMNWYVLRVASNKEGKVRDALERKIKIEKIEHHIGRIVVPTQKEKRMRAGTARIIDKKLYPGYVFVEMATDEDGSIAEDVWFLIKETTGVGDFIGSGGKPSPMPLADVERMLAVAIQHDETPALANLAFKKGDKVKVREGPFENFEGEVDDINSQKGTVRVIVTIFGRATPIEIEYWQVEQA